ncbi:filamin-binding LIM protein 1 [Candoia aspera]|uniref:filamin-binding LIM protein 1 n=1 Tax=Candoia aspera TaxID=51853 RepID=UPI002FD832C3
MATTAGRGGSTPGWQEKAPSDARRKRSACARCRPAVSAAAAPVPGEAEGGGQVGMISDKVEKRVASSVFITLAPPRRGCGPAKAPPFLPAERQVPDKEGGGTGSAPGEGASALPPPPPVAPPRSVEAALGTLPPAALPVETLGPDLQKEAAALPSSLQTPPAFLKEVRQPQPASPPGWTDRQAKKPVGSAVAPGEDVLPIHTQRPLAWHPREGAYICAFCHKGISPSTLSLEAMNKQYHIGCFTCRACHSALEGQRYYQKEGRPLCVACYQKTLEKCNACQTFIINEIVWALGRGYHPECFTCVACSREIGSDAFAVDDDDKVHCLPDFYRKFASMCGACGKLIIPHNGKDAYKVECLGRSFHEDCYRCEKCQVLLSLEPTEDGCHPLGGRLLCQACHVRQTKGHPAE